MLQILDNSEKTKNKIQYTERQTHQPQIKKPTPSTHHLLSYLLNTGCDLDVSSRTKQQNILWSLFLSHTILNV